MTLVLVLPLLLLVLPSSLATVFQGSCSDRTLLCEQLCITLSPETYECGCWNDHTLLSDGISCKVTVNPVESVATSTVAVSPEPRTRPPKRRRRQYTPLLFNGNNYAEFPISDSAYLETNITITFKISERRDGVLMFAGQFTGDDYLSISLIGPNVVLRHDCGEGAIEEMYRGPFGLDKWHTVTVWRKYCDRTEMKVDTRARMVDLTDQFKFYKGISMEEGVFIGGAPLKIEYLDNKANTDKGFIGCIKKVIINDEVLLDSDEGINIAMNMNGLSYCGAVLPGLDYKSMTTSTTTTTEIPYILDEEPEIIGYDLSRGFEPPSDRVLAEVNGKTIVRATTTEAITTTSTVKSTTVTTPSTPKIENELLRLTAPAPTNNISVFKVVEFIGDSFITVPAPQDIIEYLELSMYFKPTADDGVLFYWQDGKKYVAFFLEHGFVNVQVSMGGDIAILRAQSKVTPHQWHRAEFWRSGKGLLLKVDRQSWVEAELEDLGNVVIEPGVVYLGGYDGFLPTHLFKLNGFHGCLKKVHLNGHSVPLRVVPNQNIRECGSDPCAAAGCPQTCASRYDEFICLCDWPKYGRTCSQKNQEQLSAMKFDGSAYMELKGDDIIDQVTGDSLKLTVQMKLSNNSEKQTSQMIASAGDPTEGDFFRLVITSDRQVQFSANLGSGTVVLSHPSQLPYDRWTTVDVIRQKRHITLSINGNMPITTMAPEGSEQLNVYKSVFIGGVPVNQFRGEGLRGCIQSVDIGHETITHPRQAKSAINIQDCRV